MSKEMTLGILPETERRSSIGTVIAIVAIDSSKNGENTANPMLWTTIEKRSKPETERLVGQISFPADTRKVGENEISNMLGALPEFSENNELIGNLILMNSPSSYVKGRISVNNNPVDLAVLLVNGFPGSPIVPLDIDEVSANGWMSLEDLKKIQEKDPSHLRSFVNQIIVAEKSDKIICKVIEEYFSHPEKRVSLSTILPENTSLAEFYTNRERSPDIVGSSRVVYELKK